MWSVSGGSRHGVAGTSGLLDLARAWQVSVETGAPMSSMLDQVAANLSADQSLIGVVNSELAAARATSKVMAALPLCGIGIGYLLGGDPARWLLAGPPAGHACWRGCCWLALACCGLRLWLDAPQRMAKRCLHCSRQLGGPDPLSLTAFLCAAFAGLAVFLLLRHPAGQLRRMTRGNSRLAVVVAPLCDCLRGVRTHRR